MLNDTHARSQTPASDETPRVVSVVAVDGGDDSALLALAARLARGLEAPVATAIVESARERDIAIGHVDHFHQTARSGVAACVAGHTVVLGNSTLFADLGLSLEGLGEWPDRMKRQGQYVLFVAVDGRTVGFLGVMPGGV